jgi:putative sterol carrier protein
METITLPRTPPSDHLAPEFRDTTATYRVELSDQRSFILALDHGRLTLREGREEADCVLSCAPEVFPRVLSGDLNLLTAFMRGDVRIGGDIGAAKRLYRYLRLANLKGDRP